MRKTNEIDPHITSDEKIEVVVDKVVKASPPPSDESLKTKSSSVGMKLPQSKAKEEPDEINWDEIEANVIEIEEKIENLVEKDTNAGWGWGADEDADWGDNWNDEPKPAPKKPANKSTRRAPKTIPEPENNTIAEDNTASKPAIGTQSWDGDDDWNTGDWNEKPKTANLAGQKKAEREAKNKARKAEMEKKRAQKKGPLKLGTRKMD